MTAFEDLMLRWKDSDVDFFVPQLAAVLMTKGVPSRNEHVSGEWKQIGGVTMGPAGVLYTCAYWPGTIVRSTREVISVRVGNWLALFTGYLSRCDAAQVQLQCFSVKLSISI